MAHPTVTSRKRYGECGHEPVQNGDSCSQPALFTDDRCAWHTETDERKPQADERRVGFQLPAATHDRLTDAQRPADTLAETIDRALDALEADE